MKVGYVRVSTDQLHQGTSVERQVATFKSCGCDLILEERESGTWAERPVYQRLIKMIKLGEVREVVASRSDRLNRNQHEMRYFYNLCVETGVAWSFTDEPELNSSSPWGVELRSQKAYEAQLESEKIARRQDRYYVYAEDAGKAIARTEPLGYRITKARKYEIDLILPDLSNLVGYFDGKPYAKGEIARDLIERFLKHQTLRKALYHWKTDLLEKLDVKSGGNPQEIARLMRKAPNTLQRWLRDPVLRGHTAYGKFRKTLHGEKLEKKSYKSTQPHEWRIKWNTHIDQTLLSDVEWTIIEKILDVNKEQGLAIARSQLHPETPLTLSTILRCKHCGLRFICTSTNQKGKFYRYYYCCGRKEFHCSSKGLSEHQLVKQIISIIVSKAQELADLVQRRASSGNITTNYDQLAILQTEALEAERKYKLTGMREFLTLHQQLKMKAAQIEASRTKEVQVIEQNIMLLRGLTSLDYWRSLAPVDLHQRLRVIVKDCWIQDGLVVDIDLDP